MTIEMKNLSIALVMVIAWLNNNFKRHVMVMEQSRIMKTTVQVQPSP